MKKSKRFSLLGGILGIFCLLIVVVYVFVVRQRTGEGAVPRQVPEREVRSVQLKAHLPVENVVQAAADVAEDSVIEQGDYDGPLQELVPTEAQSRLLYEAEEAVVATCMNERGFEYQPNPYLSNDDLEPWSEPIDPGDPLAAQDRGYGIAESVGADRMPLPVSPNEKVMAEMSPEQRQAWGEAFSGKLPDPSYTADSGSMVSVEVPSVGKVVWDTQSCLSTARRAIYGSDVKQMEDQVKENALRQQIAAATERDPEYLEALEQWRNCISQHGLSYDYPGQAAGELRRQFAEGKLDIPALQAREVEVATVDATCYQQHAVGRAFNAAQQRAEAQVRSKNKGQIKALHAALQNALISAGKFVPATDSGLGG